jgi:hypothetical protein
MTRSRAFNRFSRWTAKLRRRHLRAALPEPREGELALLKPTSTLRTRAWQRDQLRELIEPRPLLDEPA